MLVLRLLVMVLAIICLMDGHAEVSSSTTGIRDRRESPAVKTNEQEVEILDRKKKKKPKPGKKKKTKPSKKKKPNKAKPTPTKPVTTTPTVSTSTLKTTTILTTPTVIRTVTTTTTTVSPTTTATTTKTNTSTASATTTLSTTTSATTTATTTTVATSSTASTTATTSSLPTTAATTADSGAGGECKATNGKPCIFPFKDGKEYNECKNEGGKYFWCATSVYDSGKYKHWSYCSTDGPCPLEGDGECRAANNKPCVFPFKDGGKEYNECADHGGKYFWCATGTNSAGKYTAWSECPKDGSCPLPQKSTTPVMTPTASAATTTLLATGTSMAPDEIENKVVSSLKDLVKEESKDGTLEMLEAMNKITQTIIEDLKEQSEDNDPKNIESNHMFEGRNPSSQEVYLQYKKGVKSGEKRKIHQHFEFVQNTVRWRGSISPVSDASGCCSECQSRWSDAIFFDYIDYFEQCLCYEKLSNTEPLIKENNLYSAGVCGISSCTIPTEDYCPGHYTFIKGGFSIIPDESKVISKNNAKSKCECKEFCENKNECLAFLFNTCDGGTQKNCLLLKVDDVDTTEGNLKNYAFCKKTIIELTSFQFSRNVDNEDKNRNEDELVIYRPDFFGILRGMMAHEVKNKKIPQKLATGKVKEIVDTNCAIPKLMRNTCGNTAAEERIRDGPAAAFIYTGKLGTLLNMYVEDEFKGTNRWGRLQPDITNQIVVGCKTLPVLGSQEFLLIASMLQTYLLNKPDNSQRTVFRATSFHDPDVWHTSGTTFISTKFISTTTNGHKVKNDKMFSRGVFIIIKLKYWGTSVNKISQYPGQDEVLVPFGVKFKVVQIEPIHNGYKGGQSLVIQWEEVD